MGPDDAMVRDWRPQGILAVHLQEHRSAINKIAVSSDGVFFATGSDDGSVKIWDCKRMERDLLFSSRLTYAPQVGKILGLVMCERRHSFACASDQGSLRIVNVEYNASGPSIADRYGGLSVSGYGPGSEWGPGPGAGQGLGAIVALEHLDSESQAVLLCSTLSGAIHAWDTRSSRHSHPSPWRLTFNPAYGYVQSIAVDPAQQWLVGGTHRGYVLLWDLRFQVIAKVWRHPSRAPIHCLLHYPFASASGRNPPRICIAAGHNEVSVWDMDTTTCTQVLRGSVPEKEMGRNRPSGGGGGVASGSSSSSRADGQVQAQAQAATEALAVAPDVDVDVPIALDPLIDPIHDHIGGGPGVGAGTGTGAGFVCNEGSVRAVLCAPDGWSGLIAAGTDRRIRWWDLTCAADSYVVSGLQPGQQRPTYTVTCLEHADGQWVPHVPSPSPSSPSAKPAGAGAGAGAGGRHWLSIYTEHEQAGGEVAAGGVPSRPHPHHSKDTSASHQPQAPSPNHVDAILDIRLLYAPQRLLVSADRHGIVKIWK